MKHNILDIKGLKVGQAQNTEAKTGVTVVIAEKGAVCGVDVRGAAPGTRETDLLNPINAMEEYRLLSCPVATLLFWNPPAALWTIWNKKASALM